MTARDYLATTGTIIRRTWKWMLPALLGIVLEVAFVIRLLIAVAISAQSLLAKMHGTENYVFVWDELTAFDYATGIVGFLLVSGVKSYLKTHPAD